MGSESSIDVSNAKKTINTCFLSEHYVVPPFQREYVWEENEIELLLNDLKEAYENNKTKEYFLGTTVVFEKDGKKQLIDGQQRMTTFFLILCVIAKNYKKQGVSATAFEQLINTPVVDADGNTENIYTLELQYEASTDCLAHIWEEDIPDSFDGLSKSSKRIYEGYEIIKKKLDKDFPDFDDYKKFASYFINRVVFIQIGAPNMSDALKIFETINQRGKGLNPLDLLKNMLFMQISENTFDKLNSKWKQMIDELERMDEKPLRFLRYYLTAKYDITNVHPDFQGILKEEDIYQWLHDNNSKCMYKEDPLGFTDGLIEGLQHYHELLYPKDETAGRDHLKNIKYLMGNSFRLHLVVLLAARGWNDELFVKLCKLFESIVYYSIVNDIKSNTIEKLFSSWCQDIRDITNQNEFDSFVLTRVKPVVDNWNSLYYQHFMMISLGNLQKYRVKTILARITKYVDEKRNNGNDISDVVDLIKSKNEIEHIMPQTCSDISQYGFEDEEDFLMYKDRLGNLTLLEKTLNATIQNNAYSDKCDVYVNSAFYLTKSLPALITVGGDTAINRMNTKLSSWDKWDKGSIEERQKMLCELSKEVWPIIEKKNSAAS